MRILHLAYEDPRQPGAGGGSLRTYEVNRRLGRRHEITALVSGYAGAHERIEDNVHYVPIGSRSGSKLDRMTYLATLCVSIHRYGKFDLVVDDFGPPFSVSLSPLFTGQPVIALVQWFFAKEMSKKYKLPFHWVERFGLRYYDDFICLSDWVGKILRTYRPDSYIETIPSGVDEQAFEIAPGMPQYLVYLGRLDIVQKGCDLLIQIMARLRDQLGDATPHLLMVGDGSDRERIKQLIASHGLEDHVSLIGWISGIEKFQLLAKAHALLMPSRFETFGVVAIEAQAVGAPVVAFDVGPLAEVCASGGGQLVPPFDVELYTQAVRDIIRQPELFSRLRMQGRRWAQQFKWDQIAERQEQHYLRTVFQHNQRR